MKAPFGKRKKTPEDNVECFVNAIAEYLTSRDEGKCILILEYQLYTLKM